MFDRVFICPDCGKADGLSLNSSDRFRTETGVGVAVFCSHCDLNIVCANLTWELAHLFLRKSIIEVRIDRDIYRPTEWLTLRNWRSLGYSQQLAAYKMISDCWMKYFYHRDKCTLKHSALETYELLFNVVFSLTVGCTGDWPTIGCPEVDSYIEDRHDVASASL